MQPSPHTHNHAHNSYVHTLQIHHSVVTKISCSCYQKYYMILTCLHHSYCKEHTFSINSGLDLLCARYKHHNSGIWYRTVSSLSSHMIQSSEQSTDSLQLAFCFFCNWTPPPTTKAITEICHSYAPWLKKLFVKFCTATWYKKRLRGSEIMNYCTLF